MLTKTNRGYSLIMWTATFAVIVSALIFFQTYLKRTIYGKVQQTSDYMLWTSWEQEVQLEPTAGNVRSKNVLIPQARTEAYMHHNKSNRDTEIRSGSRGENWQPKVSSQVEGGSESLLDEFNLNTGMDF